MDSKSNLPGMTLVNLDKYAALRPNIQDQIEIEVDDTCFEKRVYYRLISGEFILGVVENTCTRSVC